MNNGRMKAALLSAAGRPCLLCNGRMKAALLSAAGRPCLLCNGPPHVGALFVPHDQAGVAAPAGKIRTIAYSLCEECFGLPDHPKRVEAVLLGDLAEALRREGN